MNAKYTCLIIAVGTESERKLLQAELSERFRGLRVRIRLCILPPGSMSSDLGQLCPIIFRAIRRSHGHSLDFVRVPYASGKMMDALPMPFANFPGAVLFPMDWVFRITQRAARSLMRELSFVASDGRRSPADVIMQHPPVQESVVVAAAAFAKAAELACALFPIMPGWLGFRDCADAWAHFLHHFFQGTHVVAPGQKPNAEDPARIWQKTIRDVSVWLNWVGNLAYVPDDDFDFQLAIKLFAQERIAACTWGVLDAAFDG